VVDGSLHVRELATLEERMLDSTSGIAAPAWSPDGEWIAYGAGTGLMKVRRTGGSPVRIASVPDQKAFSTLGNLVWREDGDIFFTTGDTALLAVPSQGEEPREVVPLGEGQSDFHEMADLGGRGFAFIVHSEEGYGTIEVVTSDGERRQIVHHAGESLSDLAWASSGHLLYRRNGNAEGIWALPFSVSTFRATGAAFVVAPGARGAVVTSDGTLGYGTGTLGRHTTLALVDRRGEVHRTIGDPADYHRWPSLSPDGRQIANKILDGETRNLWFVDVERGSGRRFTRGSGNHSWGTWDPNGRDFWYYNEQFSDSTEIFVTPAGGTGTPRVVTFGQLPHVSPDGRWLVFTRPDIKNDNMNVWLLDLTRDGAEPQLLIEDPSWQWFAQFSPTAPLLTYMTEASGHWEVHLTTYPERLGDWPVSTKGGHWPQWNGDGTELFYAVGDSIMSVAVDATDTAPRLSRPEFLFQRPRYSPVVTQFPDGFEVTSDGQTFVLHLTGEDVTVPPAIVVTTNWVREFESD
jgi:Tol biopolymer transport system component